MYYTLLILSSVIVLSSLKRGVGTFLAGTLITSALWIAVRHIDKKRRLSYRDPVAWAIIAVLLVVLVGIQLWSG